jgi:uncharacterized protein
MKKISILGALLLTACVTINIYFPAAAAEKAADEIIKDIQKQQPQPAIKPQSQWTGWQLAALQSLDAALNVLISPAHAEADLSIDSPEIRQISASMQSRFQSLVGLYAQGVIGILKDGLITSKDPGSVPLNQRNSVNQLIAAENADRQSLYQAIANANGHPEWSGQIKSTFANRWITNAQSGWWYQVSDGSWKQK